MENLSPQPGEFYYHYKRDKTKGIEHGAYYILGLGLNTEKREDRFVVLKPLYFCEPRQTDEAGASYLLRPLEYFLLPVDKRNYKGSKFTLIEDRDAIKYLKKTYLFGSPWLDE